MSEKQFECEICQELFENAATAELIYYLKLMFEEDGDLTSLRNNILSSAFPALKKETSATENKPSSSATSVGVETVDKNKTIAKKKLQEQVDIELVNKLIMEYLQWMRFDYTSLIFSKLTEIADAKPNRECLEAKVGQFENTDVPILVEHIAELFEQKKQRGKKEDEE